MKKIIAILLCLALVLGLAACGGGETPAGNENGGETQQGSSDGGTSNGDEGTSGGSNDGGQQSGTSNGGSNDGGQQGGAVAGTGYAAARTFNKSGAVTAVDKLANTYYKLTTEKKLNVAYLGGSVTGGTGGTGGYCWASETTKWLKSKFPSAAVTEKNVAWGGTSSFWGYFRMDEDNTGRDNLIAFNPDLVFVEFTFNDGSAKLDKMQSAYYMEGIVKKLRAANPKVDIIFVFITAQSTLGADTEQILGHKAVADHYGIPTINVGKALADEIKKTGKAWSHYANDIVHPNNNGYKVYADCVAEFMNGALVASPDKSGLKDHAKPANDLLTNMTTDSEIIPAEKITNYTGFKLMNANSVNCPSMGGKYLVGKAGNKMTVEFEGKGISFLADGGTGGKIKVTVAGKSATVDVLGGNIFEYVAIENLNYGKYTAEVEIVGGSKVAFGAFLIEK